MQTALPVIWWKATCYHYVRRTRHVLRYRNGDAFTSTQVYYERVDSKTAGAAYSYSQCGVKDISRPLTDLEKYPAIKIKVSKGFSFANLETEFDFEDQRAQFFQEYETKDDYMEGREGMDLINVDFKEYMIAFRDPDRLPWYVSHAVFWAASLALLSWPLRTIIEYKTAHLHYHIHKLFGSNYLDAESGSYHPAGVMSRVSTMNSVELEMSIRNNNVIVPSYSEAMLADAQLRRDYGAIKKTWTKFPRSLTNVTLAARTSSSSSSSASRPVTPAVTMNQVKKFKSCSAFGKSSSTESALMNSGTVRHQLQQLMRERHRLQGKISRNSSLSISGISIANGNVRFSVGTPVSPDDSAISHSFSCHSVTSARDMCATPGDGCAVIAIEASTQQPRSKCPVNYSQNMTKAAKCNKYQNQSFGSIIRSKSVPGSAMGAQSLVNNTRSIPIDSPSDASASSDIGPCFIPSQPIPIPKAQMTRQDAIPVTDRPSPPSYDVAIRMKTITSPCRAQLIAAVPEIPPNTHAEIGLAELSPSSWARREIYVTGSRVFHDRKQSTDSISSVQPAGQTIDNDLSEVSASAAVGDYPNSAPDTGNVVQSSSETCDQHLPNSQYSPAQGVSKSQQLSPRPSLPPLKSLPKVCIPNIPSESEDSDSECIHSAVSELGSLENVSLEEEQAMMARAAPGSQCLAADPAAARRNAAELMTLEPMTLTTGTRERGTPSTSVASAAVALVHSQSRHHSGRHKETPV
ncbi:hypothetical protein Btru_056678 [Bulinus truncatus]|nr:hypothetical protein Btru_056678 [Bulinus truncatus]